MKQKQHVPIASDIGMIECDCFERIWINRTKPESGILKKGTKNLCYLNLSFTAFQKEVLERHNHLRAKHSAPPLQLDAGLCQFAQQWADNLVRRNVLEHRSNNKYGENLYASFGKSQVSGTEAVDSWYNEIKCYTFGAPNPSNFSQVGHFTQVVWKKSRNLGTKTDGGSTASICLASLSLAYFIRLLITTS
uniref:SCP domain-containing protein n=1 Tax=Anopheles culicifacies TaxID=139723 RepID=A0A182LXR8_9DIPT